MYAFIRTIAEEIEFYQRQNFRLQMEDLLSETIRGKCIHKKQIAENEVRIEKLWDSITQNLL